MRKVIQIVGGSLLFLLSLYSVNNLIVHRKIDVDKSIEHVNLEGINKLMIVAHPDDDMFWGGSHLIEDDYLVVCVTCGNSKRRVNEFKKVMNATDDAYLMLGYPDKVGGKRSEWKDEYDDIYRDLKHIIEYKNWDLIVTHNPEGEYGHIHHIKLNKITTSIAKDKNLWYFGKYYTKKKIKKVKDDFEIVPFYKEKINIIENYSSQRKSINAFKHMFEFENWVRSNDWE